MRFGSALVTGAGGFIGRTLVRRLVERGIKVSCLARPGSTIPKGVEAIAVPGLERAALEAGFGDHRFDVVFHLAAYGVAPSARDAQAMFEANVGGTAALVAAAGRMGARAFVYAGSCSEYVTPAEQVRITENQPLTSATLYGASKAAGGLWGQAHAAAIGLPFQWLRLFGVYGPGEAPHRLVPALAGRLRRGEPVPLTPGEQWRDFLHVEDTVTGLILGGEAALEGRLGPFNLCSGDPVSVRTFAQVVANQLGSDHKLLRFGELDYRPGETLWLVGDPARFTQATGFAPKLSLEEGLAQTLPHLS